MEEQTRVAGIIIKDGKILMLLGKGYKELWTPGGKIEPGENDEQCLRRELKEEIGVELLSYTFFKEYLNNNFYNPNKMMRDRVYIVEIEGEIKPAMEIENFVWFSKDDFEQKRFPMITIIQEKQIPDLIKAGIW